MTALETLTPLASRTLGGDDGTRSRPTNSRASNSEPSDRSILWILGGLALAKLLLHLGINAFGGYEIFRDELYYLACADHLSWGYVDQPPLSVWLLAVVRSMIGDSLFALRLIPALAGSTLVFVTGLLARELGGGRFAVVLAALCPWVAGQVLAASSIWSMNIFDLLLVALAFWALARLINTRNPSYWIVLGGLLGLGLLNKVGVLWIGLGILVGILVTSERDWLRTRWPWIAGSLSVLLFVPYLLWNATHEWAHLEFISAAVQGKYSGLSPWSFLSGQVLQQNPVTLPLWILGLVWLLAAPSGRRYRLLGVVWLTACLVLLINGHSKAGYLANAYPPLFAAGAVALERIFRRRWNRSLVVAWLLSGLIIAPLATPILPVEKFIAYSTALGQGPSTDEGHELAELPQFYADMFGWRAKAEAVATVFHSLPAEEQQKTVIFGENYGRAGAIDYWSEELGLPGAISNHNSYWWWGPGRGEVETVIVLGGDREDLEGSFEDVELAGFAGCRWCIPYERDLPIYVGRGLRVSMGDLWTEIRHYD
ncbi:MAG: glycosyltransferase family 39 protein [Thermoanaerobaculia bacterium]|nr:glycosyltransferase family 39 protein [Thermoanaerobaculia bacterium]